MIGAPPDPFIAVITAHVARNADSKPVNIDGAPGSRARHMKSLTHYEELVGRLLREFPRQNGEGPQQWHERVVSGTPRHEDAGIIGHAGRLHAIIAKMDRDAAEEEKREQAKSEARREAERNKHRRAAMPDLAEVAQLKRTVDCAADGERLLAQLFAAFRAHTSAQAARAQLNAIFDSARHARQMLRVEGEVVSKALPKQPTVRQAPDEAVAFAGIIQQVIGLRRH